MFRKNFEVTLVGNMIRIIFWILWNYLQSCIGVVWSNLFKDSMISLKFIVQLETRDSLHKWKYAELHQKQFHENNECSLYPQIILFQFKASTKFKWYFFKVHQQCEYRNNDRPNLAARMTEWESERVNWFKIMVKPDDGFVGSCFVRHNSTIFDTRRCFVSIKNGYRAEWIWIFISLRARNEEKCKNEFRFHFLIMIAIFLIVLLVPARLEKFKRLRTYIIGQSPNSHRPPDKRHSFIKPANLPTLNSFRSH